MSVPPFARRFFDPAAPVTAIGDGSPGGKARGLLLARDLLAARFPAAAYPRVRVDVPAMTVVQTDAFDRFMTMNGLWPVVRAGTDDTRLALAFQAAQIPPEFVGDLRALVEEVRSPLAVRSSSVLEDALHHPFAGVYATKMIPNDRHDADGRFRLLADAIKLVYASTFFRAARAYLDASGRSAEDEKMAVILQEIVGRRHGPRFYPDVSGVARSYSFYRSGTARPEDGFVSLALGLGKTIVDGGVAWAYSPAHPRAPAPFAGPRDLLAQTQTTFWAVSMDGRPRYDPVAEVEYLEEATLAGAEADGTLRYTASTYDAAADALRTGLRGDGPRALTFAPLLVDGAAPLNRVIRDVLSMSEQALGAPVEIEFAATLDDAPDPSLRFGFLQVRPMLVSTSPVVVDPEEMTAPACVVASDAVMGNGESRDVRDVVFVRRDRFDAAKTRTIAGEIADINRTLVAHGRGYVLIGFGRWGSADPWLGIPVAWAEIAGARAIVEASGDALQAEPSQGSHFFHNLSGFGVAYFSVRSDLDPPIDWAWLEGQPIDSATEHVRHVRLDAPLTIKVDGRAGRGVILRPEASR